MYDVSDREGCSWKGASINIAFSLDLVTWHKAAEPLYKAGGHPKGLE
jgi:hypothetical protein